MRKILFSITIVLLILFFSFSLIIFNFNFYEKEFEKYNIYDKLGKEEVDNVTIELINYFKGRGELKSEIFSEKEKLHLLDVKNLIRKSFLFFYFVLISFILLLGYSFYKKDRNIGKYFIFGGLLAFLLTLIVLLLIKINFDFLFTQFHYLAFDNELWLLSEKDILINLFPAGFFYDFMIRIFFSNCFFAFIFIIFGMLFNKVLK